MASTPGEQNGGESATDDAPRFLPTPVLTKTFQLVDDPQHRRCDLVERRRIYVHRLENDRVRQRFAPEIFQTQ